MKILFVCPTWTEDLGMFARLAKRRNSQPPLGILYLATVAIRRGHYVDVIDADVEDYTFNDLVKVIIDRKYDMVGITATSPIFHKAVALANEIKRNGFSGMVLIGGEHINIFKKEAFFDCFDYAFFGESDYTFDKFLSIVENRDTDLSSVKGIVYRKGTQIIQADPADRISNLDRLEFPAMHLLRHDRYVMSFAKFKKRVYLPILATRGCPFKCVYCSEPMTNPHVRFRSAENIVDEIQKWHQELKINHFFFMDSNLTLKRTQIEGVCNEIIKRQLKITFEGWTRANLIDKEILILMKKAGLIRISYGLESGDPAVLKIIRKEVSHSDMLNAFKMTDELGIEPACSVMLGLPGDTRESVNKTIDFVRNIPQILYSNFSIANPYPGTEMFNWSLEGKHGIHLLIKDFSEYRRYDNSPIRVNDLSPDDLVKLQKIGLLKIHFTPKRILAAAKMVGLKESSFLFIKFVQTALQALFQSKRPSSPYGNNK